MNRLFLAFVAFLGFLSLPACVTRHRYLRDLGAAYGAGQINAAKYDADVVEKEKRGKLTADEARELILERLTLYWISNPRAGALEALVERKGQHP